MKTQILRLEPHDDIISARDKMGWGQAERILLVWPESGRILTRRLDLVFLQRHSTAQRAQLALVTRDPDVRYYARQLAIPVFKSIRQAQSARWRVPRGFLQAQPPEKLNSYKPGDSENTRPGLPVRPTRPGASLSPVARLSVFTLGVLALFSIAAVLLPGAEIVLEPQVQTQEIELDVRADPRVTTIHLGGVVPATMRTVTVEGRDHLPTTGSIQIADRAATGLVLFTNLTDKPVRIPVESILTTIRTEVVRYATTEEGNVPAGSGQTLRLAVRSLSPGTLGNLPAGQVLGIEGLLGTQVTARNTLPISGGKDRTAFSPSTKDREQLYAQLFESLRRTALAELKKGSGQDDLLLSSIPELAHIQEETYDPPDAQPADQLSLSLRLDFKAPVVSGADLRAFANGILDANLPDGFIPVKGSLQLENLTAPQKKGGDTHFWKLLARRRIQAKIQPAQVIQLSMGQPRSKAAQHLASFLHVDGFPKVAMSPAWWPRLPVIPFRITVVMVDQTR